MNKDTIIETERLILRQYKISDADDVVDGLNNLNVSRWLASVPFPYTKEDALNYINNSIDNNLYDFAIVLKSENKVIGATQISNISLIHGTAGGGIWINEKYHGKGYGTEAWGARIKYAFEILGLRRLENGYFKDNISSFKMQEKFGYKNEGIRRKKFISQATGKIEDEYLTGLLKEEWIDYDKRYDNMKELVLEVKHTNWSMKKSEGWNYTEWKIYNNFEVEVKESYKISADEENIKCYNVKISFEKYNEINKKIQKAKEEDRYVSAYDGSAWKIVQYNEGKEVWKRDSGYIYGIKPLEELSRILNGLYK